MLELLVSEEDHTLDLVPYRYAGLDWRGCHNIFFTQNQPLDDRVDINIMFKLLQLHFIILLNENEIYSNILVNIFY